MNADVSPTVVILAFLAIGLCSQLIGHICPIVRQAEMPEYLWDIIGLVSTLVFTALATVYMVEPTRGWIAGTDSLAGWYATLQSKPIWLVLLINLVLADFLAYWGHRVLHTRPLWSTHAWHHSPKTINWLSGMRASPFHIVMITALPLLLSSTAVPLPHASMAPLIVAIFAIFIQHTLHSNIRVRFAQQIEWLFITPRYHRVHHSSRKHHTDSNFGFVLPVWDRLFLTYSDPQEVPAEELIGLDYEFNKTLALVGLPAKRSS